MTGFSQSFLGALSFFSILSLAACGVDAPTGDQSGALGSGLSCDLDDDCLAGEECDDNVCKLHGGDDATDDNGAGGDDSASSSTSSSSGGVCVTDVDCAGGQECEDGLCKPHGGGVDDNGAGGDDNGAGGDDSASSSSSGGGGACMTDADCAGGEECEDGLCKPHGGA
ncbi:MAG: hypothetical protein JNL21_04145 [Myxococcales bacterium]|nr:hypothetical protein [Myxococcales bacterium]